MYVRGTCKQFYTNTHEEKIMKQPFTTNWYIHNACRPASSKPNLRSEPEEKRFLRTPTRPLQQSQEFEKLLLEAVDNSLSCLGDSAKISVYFHLEETFKIKKQDIPNNIEAFVNALETIFGRGAKLIEIQIMKQLYEKAGYTFEYLPEKDGLVLTEYVEAIRF